MPRCRCMCVRLMRFKGSGVGLLSGEGCRGFWSIMVEKPWWRGSDHGGESKVEGLGVSGRSAWHLLHRRPGKQRTYQKHRSCNTCKGPPLMTHFCHLTPSPLRGPITLKSSTTFWGTSLQKLEPVGATQMPILAAPTILLPSTGSS